MHRPGSRWELNATGASRRVRNGESSKDESGKIAKGLLMQNL